MAKKAGKTRKAARRTPRRKRSSARKARNAKKNIVLAKGRRQGPPGKRAARTKTGKRAKPGRPTRSKTAGRPAGRGAHRLPATQSFGTKAGAVTARRAPGLERERRRLRDVEETIPTPPSSLTLDNHASAARTGRAVLEHARHEHTETSPALTGGDVDADWEEAYAVGDEAPGGDNPTPDQDRVDEIGRALGVEYADNEELKSGDKISARDKHRWELDPASAEDYPDHEE